MGLPIFDPDLYPLKELIEILNVSGIRVKNEKYALPVALVCCVFGTLSMIQLLYSLINLLNNLDDFFVLVYNTVLFSTLVISVIWSYVKRDYWDRMVNDFHTIFDYESELMLKKVEEIKIMREKRLKNCLYFVLFLMIFNYSNILLLGVVEYLFGNRDIVLLFPIVTPFDINSWINYSFVYIWQNLVIILWQLTVYGMLDVLTVFYDKLTSEILLFEHSLLMTEERAKEMVSKKKYKNDIQEEVLYKKALVYTMNQCGRHHIFICDYFKNAVTVIGFSYFVIVFVGLSALVCAGGSLMFGSTLVKIKFTALLSVTFTFLYVTFGFGETIREMGNSIPYLVYDIDWLKMPKECHSTLRLIMVRSMRPLEIRTSMGQKVDLENFMDLIKASYTYFNMIYQSNLNGDL